MFSSHNLNNFVIGKIQASFCEKENSVLNLEEREADAESNSCDEDECFECPLCHQKFSSNFGEELRIQHLRECGKMNSVIDEVDDIIPDPIEPEAEQSESLVNATMLENDEVDDIIPDPIQSEDEPSESPVDDCAFTCFVCQMKFPPDFDEALRLKHFAECGKVELKAQERKEKILKGEQIKIPDYYGDYESTTQKYYKGTIIKGQGKKKKKKKTKKNNFFAPRKRYPLPEYKKIRGTNIVVDGFNSLKPRITCVYFLSHFHSDHYRGLTGDFCAPIFCSEITATLVKKNFGLDATPLPMNTRVEVPGAEPRTYVTLFDANHCPGAVLFVFESHPGLKATKNIVLPKPKKKPTFLSRWLKPSKSDPEPLPSQPLPDIPENALFNLHVGDFRAQPEMLQSLPKVHFQNLYLDTTYCDPKYLFPPQQDCIDLISKAVKQLLTDKGTLILIGTYSIGKEKVLVGVSKATKQKIFVDGNKWRTLEHCKQPMKYFTREPTITQLRHTSMFTISFQNLRETLEREPKFKKIVGIKPTGWSGVGKISNRGNASILSVPYSEHSNFREMWQFVFGLQQNQKCGPHIIPTVAAKSSGAQRSLLLDKIHAKIAEPKIKLAPSLRSWFQHNERL